MSLEEILGKLYSAQHSRELMGKNDENKKIDSLIEEIKSFILREIQPELREIQIEESKKIYTETLERYKLFYQKVVLRNKDLARVNVFTTNYDIFNEKALDNLNINYNNGFGGGLERMFNPARFSYTLSRKIDINLEKFEPLENMVYLYKLHGSVSWIKKEGNTFFDIQEVLPSNASTETNGKSEDNVLIYPTPSKQGEILGSPYADLFREFQSKLTLSNSVLFVVGYSFSDVHINNIIYRSLATNASLSIFIFGDFGGQLKKINDSRVYRLFGKDAKDKDEKDAKDRTNNIHYFDYIVRNLIPNMDDNKETDILKSFVDAFKEKLNDENR